MRSSWAYTAWNSMSTGPLTGELIVVHGPKVGDRLDAQRDTYAEISRVVLPGGNRIPTLREFLEQGRKDPGTKLILELKKTQDA